MVFNPMKPEGDLSVLVSLFYNCWDCCIVIYFFKYLLQLLFIECIRYTHISMMEMISDS